MRNKNIGKKGLSPVIPAYLDEVKSSKNMILTYFLFELRKSSFNFFVLIVYLFVLLDYLFVLISYLFVLIVYLFVLIVYLFVLIVYIFILILPR